MPTVSLGKMREAIGMALRDAMNADTVEVFCTSIGLAPPNPPNDIAFTSKRAYVVRRLAGKSKPELVEIARRVLDECDETAAGAVELADLLAQLEAGVTVTALQANPHRPFTAAETKRRQELAAYLDVCSEDELVEEVLLPLFRQLGFHRVTAAGHKDKALEYGKDVWMKFTLPTQHVLYFGIQAKKNKIDSSGVTKEGTANVAEIHNQVMMMLGHEIFDPEIGKRVLVDHAFIVAGGEITKAARNWLGNALDTSQRRSIIVMDRNDILDLFVVTNLPL